MKRTTFLAIVALASLAGYTATMQGDITAAIRASGGTTTMTADPVGISSATSECLMNGKWKNERYLPSTESSGPVTFNFNVDGSFLPGEDVVVTALTFIVGGNDSGLWTDYGKRLPKAFTLRGSNDGGISWTPIISVETVEAGAFTSYTDDTEKYTYAETVSFVNWRSYRSYQITVTEAMESSSYFLQISEVAFHGLYGGSVTPPDPVRLDITAAVRTAGTPTIESNAGEQSSASGTQYSRKNMFDGTYDNRYLSDTTTTRNLLDNGNSINIDYTIGEAYERAADVIATGYTLSVLKSFTASMERMPKDWMFQGWDGSSWHTLDEITGFSGWRVVTNVTSGVEAELYSYTFAFTNSASFRKYRLSVSDVNNRDSYGGYFQLTEMQIWGYVGASLAGVVGLTTEGNDIDFVQEAVNGRFTPTITVSQYDQTSGQHIGDVARLFDKNYLKGNAFLARMGSDQDGELAYAPLTFSYAIPQNYLAGKEMVLKRYAFYSRTDDYAQYDVRMPGSWTVEGLTDDGRWLVLDKKDGYNGWQTDESNRCYSIFDIDNNLSFRQYRIRVSAPVGLSTDSRNMILLYEIGLNGVWGTGISVPPPPPKGIVIDFK